MSRHAIVLAGGKGTRLRPYTVVFPKPLLPIGGIPILETILRQLLHFGFSRATLSLGYMAGVIRSYFEGGVEAPLPNLSYFTETIPLGTSGSIRAIAPADDNFLVMNGDVLSTLDLGRLYGYHVENGAALTLAVRKAEHRLPLGVIEIDGDNVVTGFREKPVVTHLDNLGIYVYSRRVLEFMREGERCDVNDLVLDLIQQGQKVMAFVSEEPYYWIDIGQHGDFEKANEEFDHLKKAFPFLERSKQ